MEEIIKKEIGENIKKYRKAKKMSQTDLSKLLNVTVAAVSRWEAGKAFPAFSTLYDMCKILDIGIEDCLGEYALNKGEVDKKNIKLINKIKLTIKELNDELNT